jgi:hypothetical protein
MPFWAAECGLAMEEGAEGVIERKECNAPASTVRVECWRGEGGLGT